MTNTINGKTFANNFELLEDVLNYVTKGNDETTAIYEWAEQEGYNLLALTISVNIKDKTPLTVDDDFTMALVKDIIPFAPSKKPIFQSLNIINISDRLNRFHDNPSKPCYNSLVKYWREVSTSWLFLRLILHQLWILVDVADNCEK